jgi:hypothetical protein
MPRILKLSGLKNASVWIQSASRLDQEPSLVRDRTRPVSALRAIPRSWSAQICETMVGAIVLACHATLVTRTAPHFEDLPVPIVAP